MKSVIVLLALVSTQLVFANPVNFSLTPDIAMKSRDTKINGVVIGIWSENPQSAFALGFVNGSTGTSQGVSLAILGNYTDDYTGAHLGIANYAKGHFTGAQLGAFNYAKKMTGVQFGFVNYAETLESGLQIGLVNFARSTTEWFKDFPNQVAPIFPFLNWSFN